MKLAESILKESKLNEDAMSDFKKLKDMLYKAAKHAEKASKSANAEPDVWQGNEGSQIAECLREIWNAFSTGKKSDRSAEDEIFK